MEALKWFTTYQCVLELLVWARQEEAQELVWLRVEQREYVQILQSGSPLSSNHKRVENHNEHATKFIAILINLNFLFFFFSSGNIFGCYLYPPHGDQCSYSLLYQNRCSCEGKWQSYKIIIVLMASLTLLLAAVSFSAFVGLSSSVRLLAFLIGLSLPDELWLFLAFSS